MTTQDTSTPVQEIQALYVQTAGGVTYAGGKLTLHNLAPATLFFSETQIASPAM